MDDRMCNLFEVCETPEAPLCPLQRSTIKHGIWYGDEAICRAKQFQSVPWIKKQILIAGLRLKTDDGFFTVSMLNSLKVINSNLKGANPDDVNPEQKWLRQRKHKTGPNQGIKKDNTTIEESSVTLKLF